MPPSLLARCDDGAETAALQRARGSAEARVRRLGERTKLADLRQEGCLKLRFPRLPQASVEAVLDTFGLPPLDPAYRDALILDWRLGL